MILKLNRLLLLIAAVAIFIAPRVREQYRFGALISEKQSLRKVFMGYAEKCPPGYDRVEWKNSVSEMGSAYSRYCDRLDPEDVAELRREIEPRLAQAPTPETLAWLCDRLASSGPFGALFAGDVKEKIRKGLGR